MEKINLTPLVAVTGGNGSGKDSWAAERLKHTGIPFVTGSDILRNIASEQGLDPNDRAVLGSIAAELTKTSQDPAKLVNMIMEEYDTESGLSIVSIRRVAEAEAVKRRGGMVLWLDAPIELRYERAFARKRGSDDMKTFEEFVADENREMYSDDPSNPFLMNMSAIREMADVEFVNDGDFNVDPHFIARAFNFTR